MNLSTLCFILFLLSFNNLIFAKTLTSDSELKGGKYNVEAISFKEDLKVCDKDYYVKCPPMVLENATTNFYSALDEFIYFCNNKTTGFVERCHCVENPLSRHKRNPEATAIVTLLKKEPQLENAALVFTDKDGNWYPSFKNENPTSDSSAPYTLNCHTYEKWQKNRKQNEEQKSSAGRVIGN